MAVVVTVAKGYDLGYIWKTQDRAAGLTTGGYYINAAQAGEPPPRPPRQPAAYTDVTFSFSKSISVLHASIRENERRARLAGDQQVLSVAYWAGREKQFQEILHRAGPLWSTPRRGPGPPAPATTAPGSTAANPASSNRPG